MLTIGGACGALMGSALLYYFPNSGITIHMSALIGMSAMFAGASRALLTSIIFALESTGQSAAILPLPGACIASYIISYFLLENTIMTEKIARRGLTTPSSFEPDILIRYPVADFMLTGIQALIGDNTLADVQDWMKKEQLNAEQPAPRTQRSEVAGLLSYNDTLEVYRQKLRESNHFGKEYSLKHQAIRIILKGKGILSNH